MILPATLHAELNELTAQRDSYHYEGSGIATKILVGLIAPTAVGKSTVANEILRQCQEQGIDAAEVGSITTRARRFDGSDPANYRTATEGITHQELIGQIKRRELINWSLSPTGDLYATDVSSYPAEYNLLPLLPDSIPMMRRAGFRKFIAVYLTAPVEEWQKRLTDRENDPKFAGRLDEAASSLEYAKTHLDTLFVLENNPAPIDDEVRPEIVAKQIIELMRHAVTPQNSPDTLTHIEAMLAYARQAREKL